MPPYQSMYAIVCDAASRALDYLQADPPQINLARILLQQALWKAEEQYIENDDCVEQKDF